MDICDMHIFIIYMYICLIHDCSEWQWSFLDKNKGTSYVELELFTTKSSSNYLTIFDVRIDGLKYVKNEKLIRQKVSFEMNRFKDKFKNFH